MPLLTAVLLAMLGAAVPETPQTASTPKAANDGPAAAEPNGRSGPKLTTYRSDALHFSYAYPASFQPLGGMVQDALDEAKGNATGIAKAAVSCVSAPVAAIDASDGFQMIFILKLDGTCLGATPTPELLGGLVTQELRESMGKFGTPIVAPAVPYTLGGHSASLVTASVSSAQLGGMMYGSAACVITGKDTVCWEFVSNSCDRLSTLSNYAVSFEANAPEPVVPAKLYPACKP